MASQDGEITEFVPFTPKTPDDFPSATFESVTSTLKSASGVLAVQHGARLEDPTRHLLVIRWASHADFKSWSASESYTPWLMEFKRIATSLAFYQSRLGGNPSPSPASPVLDAPVTEVLVAYGIEKPAFAENLREFSEKMGARGRAGEMEGWHANAWGEVTTPIAKEDGEEGGEEGGEKGDAAVFLAGWDSKDHHLKAKSGPGRESP